METTIVRFGRKGATLCGRIFSVFDAPHAELKDRFPADRNQVTKLLAEIKREHERTEEAKATQVRPVITFSRGSISLVYFWDDTEQRFFYKTANEKRLTIYIFSCSERISQLSLIRIRRIAGESSRNRPEIHS